MNDPDFPVDDESLLPDLGDRLRAIEFPDAALDARRAAVLELFESESSTSRPVAPVIALRPRRFATRGVRWAAAAAAAVVLAVGVSSLSNDTGDQSSATMAGTAFEGATGADAREAAGAAADATGSAIMPAPFELGTHRDLAALATAYRATVAATKSPETALRAGDTSLNLDGSAQCPAVFARATLGTTPVVLVVREPRVAVLDARTCVALAEFTP
jgi:hypothetical protein